MEKQIIKQRLDGAFLSFFRQWGLSRRYFGLPLAGLTLVVGLGGCASTHDPMNRPPLSPEQRARLLVEIANGALMEGDAVGALQQLAKAELEAPDLPEIYHSKALAYFEKHELDTALRWARKAVELKPDYPEANSTVGKILLDKGKYQEAVPYLKIAANNPLYRQTYKANTNLGIIKYRMNEFLQAETYFDKAIQEAPEQACIAYYYRGHIQLNRSKFKEAIQDYDKSTRKTCARFGDGQFALGVAYEKSRQFQLARKTFLEIQRVYPNTKLAEQAMDRLKNIP